MASIVSVTDEQTNQRDEAPCSCSHSQDVVIWAPWETTAGLALESSIVIIAKSTPPFFFLVKI